MNEIQGRKLNSNLNADNDTVRRTRLNHKFWQDFIINKCSLHVYIAKSQEVNWKWNGRDFTRILEVPASAGGEG